MLVLTVMVHMLMCAPMVHCPPPGVRMSEAFQEVRESLERHCAAQKGGVQRHCRSVWPLALTAAWPWHARPGSTWGNISQTCEPWRAP